MDLFWKDIKTGVFPESFQFTIMRASGYNQALLIRPQEILSQQNQMVMIFFHGTGNDHIFPYIEYFKTILKCGYHVLTVDLDGHGVDSTSILDETEIFSFVENMIETCKAKFNFKTILLSGHSLGGIMCIEALYRISKYPTFIVSPPSDFRVGIKTIFFEILGFFKKHVLKQVKFYGIYGALPAAGSFKRTYFPIRINTEKKTGFYYLPMIQKIILTCRNLLKDDYHFKAETLWIVTAEKDQLALQDKIYKTIAKRYFTLPSENHMSILFAPETLRLLTVFLTEHSTRINEGL